MKVMRAEHANRGSSETAQCPACLRTGRFWTIQTHAVACIEQHARANASAGKSAGDLSEPSETNKSETTNGVVPLPLRSHQAKVLRQPLPSTPPPVVATSAMSPEPKRQRTRSSTMSPRQTQPQSASPPVSEATAAAAFAHAARAELLRAVDEYVEESQESYFWEMMADHSERERENPIPARTQIPPARLANPTCPPTPSACPETSGPRPSCLTCLPS